MQQRLVAIEVTVTLVDVIEIGFLSHSAHRDDPPTPPPSQTQKRFLQDLTITRGAFNQSGMWLGGPSDGRGGRKRVITPSQSLSPVLFCLLSRSLSPLLFYMVHPLRF